MKVLQINSVSGYGSTGTICEEIAATLESEGHECFIAYGQLTSSYKNNFKIGSKIENHLHNLGSRIFGKQGYFTKNGTSKLITFIKEFKPDVIHLHNLHGNYLNLPILFSFLRKFEGKIVYTLHDCWAFTGKCAHYTSVNCYKWQTECKACPQIQKYPQSLFLDYSTEMFRDKKEWLTHLPNLEIITVSHWLESQVRNSFLKEKNIQTIYNWIDIDVFKPIKTENNSYYKQIDTTKFTLLFVSAYWQKNDEKWLSLVQLASNLSEEFQLVIVGNVDKNCQIPKNVLPIGYINSKQKMAELYNIADVYLHLSSEDTFGKVIAEALSCGTPAIVYNATACPEIVGENCGYVVEKENIPQMIESINRIKSNTKDYYSQNCISFVKRNFLMQPNINKTINLYQIKN